MKLLSRVLAVTAALIAGLCIGVLPASAATYAVTGVSRAPYAHTALAVSTGLTGSHNFRITAWYDGADLVMQDLFYSPMMCFNIFDVENAHTSYDRCTPFAQNRTSDTVSGTLECTTGHRYRVDVHMYAHHIDPATGRTARMVTGLPSLKVVCGGKTWNS